MKVYKILVCDSDCEICDASASESESGTTDSDSKTGATQLSNWI
jgi:hypothetical protein